jgi:hypothetical protein
VGQGGGAIGKSFDIKKDRTGDMKGKISRMCIDLRGDTHGRQGGIEDYGVRIFQAISEPGGRDQRLHRLSLILPRLKFAGLSLLKISGY